MKKSHLVNILGVIVILGGIFLYDFAKHKKLEKNHRYTIGTVKGVKSLSRGGVAILYNFRYAGIVYTGERPTNLSESERNKLVDKRFIVKFNPDKPNVNSIELNNIIIDSTLKAPTKGWLELPKIQ